MDRTVILVRWAFTKPLLFRAGIEAVRRGMYKIKDRKRHWLWEWVIIEPVEEKNA